MAEHPLSQPFQPLPKATFMGHSSTQGPCRCGPSVNHAGWPQQDRLAALAKNTTFKGAATCFIKDRVVRNNDCTLATFVVFS